MTAAALSALLLLVAVILLVLAAFPIPSRVNLLALGLAFFVAGGWLVQAVNAAW